MYFMKPILLLALIALTCHTHAADNETAAKNKVTHHVQFLFGNYVSESVLTSRPNQQYYYINTPPGQINPYYDMNHPITWGSNKPTYTPLYSYSIGFDYKVEFSNRIGLRTGFNYFTYGFMQQGKVENGFDIYMRNYKQTLFISSLLIPAHFMMYSNVHKGRLVFSAGPDLYLPINSFGNSTTSYDGYSAKETIRYHSGGGDFFSGGSLGFTAGIGYEKKISDKLALEFMPDFRVLNIVPFDFQSEGAHLYQNYIFNMSFGLSTYITFY
jgi:hypothetical protein